MEAAAKTEVSEKIAKAAFSLFCRKGIKAVSMDDIARHLAISKKTIYKCFVNKDQVVYRACVAYISATRHDYDHRMKEAGNALEELFVIMEVARKVFADLHPAVFHDLQKYHRSSWELWINHKSSFVLNIIKQNIMRGMEEGLFRSDLEIDIMARFRLVLMEAPFKQELFPPHQFNIQRVHLAGLEHYMLGMATLKGHRLINAYKHIIEEE